MITFIHITTLPLLNYSTGESHNSWEFNIWSIYWRLLQVKWIYSKYEKVFAKEAITKAQETFEKSYDKNPLKVEFGIVTKVLF